MISRRAACAASTALMALGAMIAPVPVASAVPILVPASAEAPQRTGLRLAVATSGDGRYILGSPGTGKMAVWDVVKDRSVRKLPATARYRYFDISATGKVISYTKTSKFNGCQVDVPKVRSRASGKSRLVATDRKGRQLAASWRPASCPGDEDDSRLSYMAQFSHPALSGNGRYVAFCGNLRTAASRDLYRKDLRNGSVLVWPDACSTWLEGGDTGFVTPQISYDGQVILLPGTPDSDGAASHTEAFQLLVGGQLRPPVTGSNPQLDGLGDGVFATRRTSCPTGYCPVEQFRYDVASGTATVLAADAPVNGSMSATGSHALGDPFTETLAVHDLAAGTVADLVPVVAQFGLVPQAYASADWSPWYSGEPMLTPDGTSVVFSATDGRVYMYRWVA